MAILSKMILGHGYLTEISGRLKGVFSTRFGAAMCLANAVCVGIALLCFTASADISVAASLEGNKSARLEPLIICSRQERHGFDVEVADTENTRMIGLMDRQSLPEGQGMLFDFHAEQPVTMWMKNTYIPLDMLFINQEGRIIRIAERTTPLSLALISSGGNVRSVLELAGGSAERLSVRAGDYVGHRIFTSDECHE